MRQRSIDVNPFETETEFMAWTFGMLAGAYGRVAELEKAERSRENQDRADSLKKYATERSGPPVENHYGHGCAADPAGRRGPTLQSKADGPTS